MYSYLYMISEEEYKQALNYGVESIIGDEIKALGVSCAEVHDLGNMYILTYKLNQPA